MANISNPNNIKGMARLLANDEDDDAMEKSIEEIEKSITNGGNIKGTDGEIDYAASFIKGSKKNGTVRKDTTSVLPIKKEQKITMPIDKGLIGSDDESDDYDKIINQSSRNGHVNGISGTSGMNGYGNSNGFAVHKESDDDEAPEETKRPMGPVSGGYSNFNQFSAMSSMGSMPMSSMPMPMSSMPIPSAPPMPSFSQFAPPKFNDPNISRLTEEQKKQNKFREVMSSMEPAPADDEVFNQEDEEEEMAHMVEQIDTLKSNLTEAGIDISNIQEVTVETPKREAQKVLRVLQIKNDRLRYCDIFEETILAAAYALEKFFDGEREIFGKRIDMNGYSDTVRVKLKRMRYDTGTFVSGVMKGYNISSGWRIALEILPTLFTYTRRRSIQNRDNLGNSQEFRKAMQDLYPEKNTK